MPKEKRNRPPRTLTLWNYDYNWWQTENETWGLADNDRTDMPDKDREKSFTVYYGDKPKKTFFLNTHQASKRAALEYIGRQARVQKILLKEPSFAPLPPDPPASDLASKPAFLFESRDEIRRERDRMEKDWDNSMRDRMQTLAMISLTKFGTPLSQL